jgi:hypothetical protein
MAGGSRPAAFGSAVGSILGHQDVPEDNNPDDYLSDLMIFADFCSNDLETDGESFDVCVSAIQRYQNARFQRGNSGPRG